MKLSKVILYLFILLGLACYVYFGEILHKEKKEAEETASRKMLNLDKDKIVKIELKSDKGKIELQKPADFWVLTEPVKARADASAVEALLIAAVDASSEKTVMEKDVKWEEFGLDKPEFIMDLYTDQGMSGLLFGARNAAKTSYYVRVDDRPALLMVEDTLRNSLDKTVFDLRDKSIVRMAPEDVDRILISKKDEKLELVKENPDSWIIAGSEKGKAKADVIAWNLRNITNLTAKDIIDEPSKEANAYGFDDPVEIIVLTGKKLEQSLEIGATAGKEAAEKYYARVKGSDTVYVVDEKSLKSIKTSIREIQDRSLLSLHPREVERVEINLDGKTWVAAQDKDKKWSLEKPEKKENIEAWAVNSVLWDLKDFEWKSFMKPAPEDLDSIGLKEPKLTVTFKKTGQDDPVVIRAGWKTAEDVAAAAGTRDAETANESQAKSAENPNKPSAAGIPEQVYVIVKPHEEKDVVFVVDGNFLGRFEGDLKKLSDK